MFVLYLLIKSTWGADVKIWKTNPKSRFLHCLFAVKKREFSLPARIKTARGGDLALVEQWRQKQWVLKKIHVFRRKKQGEENETSDFVFFCFYFWCLYQLTT